MIKKATFSLQAAQAKNGKKKLINEHLFNYLKNQTATFDPKLTSDQKMTEF